MSRLNQAEYENFFESASQDESMWHDFLSGPSKQAKRIWDDYYAEMLVPSLGIKDEEAELDETYERWYTACLEEDTDRWRAYLKWAQSQDKVLEAYDQYLLEVWNDRPDGPEED